MSLFTLGLALILSGIVIAALGAVNLYYDRFVFRNFEEYDAVVTKLRHIKGKSWSPYESIQINAEYSVEGRRVEGAYYTLLLSSIVKYNVGDCIVVQVNPKNPKSFRTQEIEDTTEMQYTHRRSPIIAAVGAFILAAGIIMIFLM